MSSEKRTLELTNTLQTTKKSKMSSKLAIVYGGCGALGRACVKAFSGAAGWKVCSVDFSENADAAFNVIIKGVPKSDAEAVLAKLKAENQTADAVLNVAGGWAGGDIKSAEFFESCSKMLDFNLNSSLAASYIAGQVLNKSGLFVLTGAAPVLKGGTPGMIGYGVSKAATHQLLQSVSSKDVLPEGAIAIGIAPETLDTPSNRQAMPKADLSKWTPCDELAQKLVSWANGQERPTSGAMVTVLTRDGKTSYNTNQCCQ